MCSFTGDVELAAVFDNAETEGTTALRALPLELPHNIHAFGDAPEHDMVAIKPGARNSRDEELASVCVWTSVSHRQKSRDLVRNLKAFVSESPAVDGLSAGSVAARDVPALYHEVGDDAVERRALVVEGLPALAVAFLAGADRAEVLAGDRGPVAEELEHDAADRFVADLDVEEGLGPDDRHRKVM